MSHYDRSSEYVECPKYGPRFTADDVRALRDKQGCGMMEAKGILMKEQILSDIQLIKIGGWIDVSIWEILEYLIENNHITF